MIIRAIAGAMLLASLTSNAVKADEASIDFPADYRSSFTNYLNLDRTQNPDQIIRLFANDIALEGVRANGEFPDGSVLVGEIYKAKKDGQGEVLESGLGRRIRGPMALVAVMEKGAGWGARFPKELRTGDWDFAAFKPDGVRAEKNLDQCRACHAPLTDIRYVFSYEHLK